ncbi:SAM-dependent methyltransferase [Lusitaniella coriacea LEGE 07157]|uniref:SAM-dependent methyltransferase n=1 Tax=Lusitaniella coriacea LEGE 07157 TaxID=945747 RepID=A0A8J7DXD5_9CYAN|nr:SAM-dependent methyltransferase [Lusitaniella coriacea]MBE9116735.1 SAM-dependent methyltransferase [Lusitaniella coriacea LEGE 07157]
MASFKLEKVVPWGRSLEEYIKMFDLSETDRQKSILDCAGGPSSFNAEMTRLGGSVISCDPIYQFSARDIHSRIHATYPIILKGLKATPEKFVWQEMKSPEHLGKARMLAMQTFLEDFPKGRQNGRYKTDEFPNLSFEKRQFDLALCSHFLFTYSEQFPLAFHLASILEMCRVATEVRVFPLLENFTGEPSLHLEKAINHFIERGYQVTVESVPYEFQRNGNQMLRIRET